VMEGGLFLGLAKMSFVAFFVAHLRQLSEYLTGRQLLTLSACCKALRRKVLSRETWKYHKQHHRVVSTETFDDQNVLSSVKYYLNNSLVGSVDDFSRA
jgi:hypothetical protein